MSFWNFSMFLDFFFIKKKILKETKQPKTKTRHVHKQLKELNQGQVSNTHLREFFSHPYSTSLRLCRWKSIRIRVYLKNYTNLLRETKILQISFTSQQAQIFQKNMKQFIWTYGKRNIITNPRLKHRMLKFQFMTIRTNVAGDTTKVTNRNKFRNIRIPNNKSSLRFWFLPQQRIIWSNMTNNTTKVIGWHKNKFIMLSNSRFRLRFRNFSVNIRTFTFV